MISIQTAFLMIFALLGAQGTGDAAASATLLTDGAVLSQVPGTAVFSEAGGWRFSTAEALTSGEIQLPAGYEMRLLPCRGLELIEAYAGGEGRADVRLTGIVADYEGMNFLFALDAVPVRKEVDTPPDDAVQMTPPGRLITDPNETSVMPQEIFQQLQAERQTDFAKITETPDLPEDRMLINRTGFFAQDKGHLVFKLNGFGLTAASRTCRLLPGKYRREVEGRMQTSFSKPRFSVSAIESTYRGQTYLLLQRVRPARSYGNFTP